MHHRHEGRMIEGIQSFQNLFARKGKGLRKIEKLIRTSRCWKEILEALSPYRQQRRRPFR